MQAGQVDHKLPSGIATRTFVPSEPKGQHIVIASATGVLQGYYKHFAAWMAGRGYHVTSFDYSGIGESRSGSLKKHPATASTWAEEDLTAVIEHVHATYEPSKLIGLGHSIGGQFFGICKAQDKLNALVLIASQHGYFKNWDQPHRRRISFQWLVLIPVFTRVFGYFPGKRLGVMEDLPPGMVHEWVKWGRSPGYLFDHVPGAHERYANLHVPLLFWSFSDDHDLAPKRAAEALAKHYVNCRITHEHIHPDDLGVEAIGHFGFFKKGGEERSWPALVERMGTLGV
jgi:predicted alpha/beta hydrolase